MSYDNTNKGALWSKVSQNGKEFYSGFININGIDYPIVAFVNDKWNEGSKLPRFNLQFSQKQDNNQQSNNDDF